MTNYLRTIASCAVIACTVTSEAQFIPDDFNSTTLGPQWTWQDSTPPGSTYNLNGTHLELKAIEGADLFFTVDNYAYLQQNAPTGTNWEIITKIENFDPTEAGRQNNWNKSGIMLWQDNEHWFGVWVMGNNGLDGGSWSRWVEGAYDCFDPARGGNHLGEYAGDQAYRNITADPIWLKIQKTEYGYMGFYSTDGLDWIQVNRLIRNSENPANGGYFTDEKIRIIQSGPGTNGTNDTASFDFIQTGPVTVPTAAAGTNDEFNGTALDTTLWGVYEGWHESDISVSGGTLKITTANFNDQWGGIDRAARVFQHAPPVGDWHVTAKVGPNLLFDYQDWSGYGMLLWQDQNDWVHLANARTGGSGDHMVQSAFQRDNAHLWNVNEVNILGDPLPEYLRITKQGLTYTTSYSYDDVSYTTLGSHAYPAELQNPQVQLFGKKVSAQGGPQLVAEFDWVRFVTLSNVDDWQLY